MARFSYKAYDDTGALKAGEIESDTREAALESLFRRGEYPLEVVEGRAGASSLPWWQRDVFGSGRLSHSGLTLFTRELAMLIKAEIPVDEALRIVALQPLIPMRTRQITRSVLERVMEGASLSEALAEQNGAFPEFHWRLVQAGEASGALGGVLDDLAGFLERSADVRSRVTSALLYPAILVIAALVALGVIMTVLVPTLVPLFEDAGATPPLFIRVLIDVQEFMASHWLLVLVGLALLVVLLIGASTSERLRASRDRGLLKVPLVSGLISRRETARFARTLATLIRNGVPMLQAVRIAGGVLNNRAYRAAAISAEDELQKGGTLSSPLARSRLFSDLSLRLISVGEQTGQLEVMLARVADIYESALQNQLQRVTSLLTPVLTIVIGLFVGGLILSVMGAIVSINELAFR